MHMYMMKIPAKFHPDRFETTGFLEEFAVYRTNKDKNKSIID